MDDYKEMWRDNGGVHINSNIHNKAAYNLLTMGDDFGNRVFTPREVALFYYLTLVRLGPLAGFSKTLQALVDVASTYYSGDPIEMADKVGAIKRAYEAVGILMPE
jgi:Zn-dependent metalloprotease